MVGSILFVAVTGGVPSAAAQTRVPISSEAFPGSEAENYLRVLQDLGQIPLRPWSIRPFSPKELDQLANTRRAHPWSDRYAVHPDTSGGLLLRWIRPEFRAVYNTGFPYGFNDGPIWAGRGLTTMLQGGVSVRYGFASLVIDPVIFRAENASFSLVENGKGGKGAFEDARNPINIDLPQRYGAGPYQDFYWGQSTFRLDLPIVTAGVSTAEQIWGPARDFPLILGDNAAGFPHAFLGTSSPVDVWLAKIHAHLVWGVLHQSEFSSVHDAENRRFMSGLVATFVPRGVPGLEFGGARFYHSTWPADGLTLSDFTKPLEGLLKSGLPDTGITDGKSDADNQLASVFARWVLPHSGFEIYGEYAREDHNWDLRDFLLEPDHDSGYMLGAQRAIRIDSQRVLVVRGEVLNSRPSHLARVRAQAPFYIHSRQRQGHTVDGQILGSPAAYGGSGAVIAADYYEPRGRLSLSWVRQAVLPGSRDGKIDPAIQNAVSLGSRFFLGFGDLNVELAGVRETDRIPGSSSFNLNASLGIQWSY